MNNENINQNQVATTFVDETSGEIYINGHIDETVSNKIVPYIRNRYSCIGMEPKSYEPKIIININSQGGLVDEAFALITEIEEAKKAGFIIETRVLSVASSAASYIAVCGTKGYRGVSKLGHHLVHNHKWSVPVERLGDADKGYEAHCILTKFLTDIYLQHCKMSKKEIEKCFKEEHTRFYGSECIDRGLSDYLIG